jgi:hypothetical protein
MARDPDRRHTTEVDYDAWGTPGYPPRDRYADDPAGDPGDPLDDWPPREAASRRSRTERGERAPVWYGEDPSDRADETTGAWASPEVRREWSAQRRRSSLDRDPLTGTGPIPISPVPPAAPYRSRRPVTATGRARVPQRVAGLPTVPRQSRRRDWDVTSHSLERIEVPVVEGERQYLASLGWTTAWYAVPYSLYAAWTLTFDGKPGTACAKPVNNACPPVRSAALEAIINGLPRVGVALGIALLITLMIRLGSGAWRPATTAFSAAIIGAGLATILYSVIG